MKVCCKKTCSLAGILQGDENFSKDPSRKDGIQRECRACRKQRYYLNRDQEKDTRLKRDFGITLKQYRFMLTTQDFMCKLCKRDPKEYKESLAVDHCHKTGKIRGLLCRECNTSLGLIKENSVTLLNMIKYLEEHTVGSSQVGKAPPC